MKHIPWFNLRVLLIFIWGMVATIAAVFWVEVDNTKEKQLLSLRENIINDAINHFDDMVAMRKWNAGHGGLYIKQHDNLQPNPYLKDNVAYTSENEMLIKVNPAWMTRQISEMLNKNQKVQYKITSLQSINPANAPDAFEIEALTYLQAHRETPYYYRFDTNESFKFMGALYVEQGCLKCHEEQGYKLGDVRGGISVFVPSGGYQRGQEIIVQQTRRIHFAIVSVALVIGFLLTYMIMLIIRHRDQLMDLNAGLEAVVQMRTHQLHELNTTLERRVDEEIAKNKIKEEMMIRQSSHAAMGEMIGMIAHQWRQPVSTLSMIANKMVLDIELGEVDLAAFEKDAEQIIYQAEYLSKTIDDFSDFFKPNKVREEFRPFDVLHDALIIFGKSLENNNIVIRVESKSTSSVMGYPHELLQVYLNLIKNAKEALVLSHTSLPSITIRLLEEKNAVITQVCDNGSGIDASIIGKIFIPYFTTKQEYNGTGLGLYMSKIIVENHFYGKISVTLHDDLTCFTVSLPKSVKEGDC